MASWENADWESGADSGLPRRDRRTGPFRRYVPDLLEAHPLTLDGSLSLAVADAERSVRALSGRGGAALTAVSRFLLRSEAIASSFIEGVAPSPQQVALAELGKHESVRGISEQAQLVANNMTVVRRASTELVEADLVTVEHIVGLQAALLPDHPRHHGLRTVQNWIGGSQRHPLDADFVPPEQGRVPALMQDLAAYINGAGHSPIVQAALVHAQFETIHPFTDGNGRVGRALIHTVLTRRGLTPTAILPVSLVLATLRDTYVAGLVGYRYDGDAAGEASRVGIGAWIKTFSRAALLAAEQSTSLVSQLKILEEEWRDRIAAYRSSRGIRETPRADSATARMLTLLPEAPVVTTGTVQRILRVSFPAASSALEELRQAGILQGRPIERGATAYMSQEVLDLITLTERRLASTQFDTRASQPNRPVPAPSVTTRIREESRLE